MNQYKNYPVTQTGPTGKLEKCSHGQQHDQGVLGNTAAAAAAAASSIRSQRGFYSLQTHGVSGTGAKLERDGAGDKATFQLFEKSTLHSIQILPFTLPARSHALHQLALEHCY